MEFVIHDFDIFFMILFTILKIESFFKEKRTLIE